MPNSTKYMELTNGESKLHKNLCQKIIRSIMHHKEENFASVEKVSDWIGKVIEHNASACDAGRILVVEAYKTMGKILTGQTFEHALVLDWCIAIYCGANRISDDMMDGRTISNTSGERTWHSLPNVGTMALCDSFLLRKLSFKILKESFHDNCSYYPQLEDIRANMFDNYIMGRVIYQRMLNDKNIRKTLQIPRYRQVVDFTFSYGRFYVPVCFALTLNGKVLDTDVEKHLKDILLDIGYYRRLEMDNGIIFGDKADVECHVTEGDLKVNWFFVKAVEKLKESKTHLNELIEYARQLNIVKLREVYENYKLVKSFNEEKIELEMKIKLKVDSFHGLDTDIRVFLLSLIP